MTRYNGTIDWDRYWTDTGIQEAIDASPSAEYIVDPFLCFLEEMGRPTSYADMGCGAGAVVFAVAERHPGTSVVGFDASQPVLNAARDRANTEQLPNVSFERAVLPDFQPAQQFDVVSSFFTLCYVAEVEEALRNLFEAVAPGGYLVITYHNRFARSLFEDIAESPSDYLDESSSWAPERFSERFELVLNGDSLLSYQRIHDVLGTWPRSLWSVSDDLEPYGAWRQNPLVYVPK